MPRKYLFGGAAGLVVAGLISAYLLVRPASSVVAEEHDDIPQATADQLTEVAGLRVYFGHQSVGRNLLHAMPRVFQAAGAKTPTIVDSANAAAATGPAFQHTYVGENGDPLGKIAEFDKVVRGGLGDQLDVAVLKLCYSDVHDGDDVETVFAAYRTTLAALERDHPEVTFMHTTVPVMAEGDTLGHAKDRIKRLLGRDGWWPDPSHNVQREELNQLIRAEYGNTGRLFDIAKIEATGTDGIRQLREHDGSTYYALERALASDPGHLNRDGADFVASAFLAMIAEVAD